MFTAGIEIGFGIVLALACVCIAPFLVAYVIGAALDTLGRVIDVYERFNATRLTVPKPNWFNQLSDGTQLMLAAWGTIGLMFGLSAIARVVGVL